MRGIDTTTDVFPLLFIYMYFLTLPSGRQVIAPVMQSRYGYISVITDGVWMTSYVLQSELELAQVYYSSLLIEEMWFEVDLEDEHLICAVNIYGRQGSGKCFNLSQWYCFLFWKIRIVNYSAALPGPRNSQ